MSVVDAEHSEVKAAVTQSQGSLGSGGTSATMVGFPETFWWWHQNKRRFIPILDPELWEHPQAKGVTLVLGKVESDTNNMRMVYSITDAITGWKVGISSPKPKEVIRVADQTLGKHGRGKLVRLIREKAAETGISPWARQHPEALRAIGLEVCATAPQEEGE